VAHINGRDTVEVLVDKIVERVKLFDERGAKGRGERSKGSDL
jgi:hypothetical protein